MDRRCYNASSMSLPTGTKLGPYESLLPAVIKFGMEIADALAKAHRLDCRNTTLRA